VKLASVTATQSSTNSDSAYGRCHVDRRGTARKNAERGTPLCDKTGISMVSI
jgi:hypothetical protein